MAWSIDTDQLVEVAGLVDPVTGAYVNTATVQATMYHADGVTLVAGQSWPLTLDYVIASNGIYRGILEDGRVLEDGRTYFLVVTTNAGGDLVKKFRRSYVASYAEA